MAGQRHPADRQGEGSFTLYGRRLVHLMVQPGVARAFMADPMAADTGFLPRFLICAPYPIGPCLGVHGGIDLIRDPCTRAAGGQLVLTALVMADFTVPRGMQTRILTGLEAGTP